MKGLKLIQGGEILLFGTVVPDRWIWPEDTGYFSSLMVVEALGQFNNGPVTVRVNCDGGNPFEGEAVRVALAEYPGEVTVKIQGAAHSAASLFCMGADHLEMSLGSAMLIHDPSTGLYGNPAEIRSGLEDLEALADIYAGVYAQRTGKTVEEARAVMVQGITYSPTLALEEGFIDKISDLPPAVDGEVADTEMHQMAQAAMRAAADRAYAAQMKFDASQASDQNSAAGAKTGAVAPQSIGENEMGKKNQSGAGATPAVVMHGGEATPSNDTQVNPANGGQSVVGSDQSAPDQTVSMQGAGQDAAAIAAAVEAERQRGAEIRELAEPFSMHLEKGFVDQMISQGQTVDQARAAVMSAVAAAQPQTRRAVVINRDETDTRMEGMIGALMHRTNPGEFALEGAAEDFRGLRLRSLAMHLAGGLSGFNEIDTVQRGMRSTSMTGGAHGISDFAYITREVLNRTLRAAYKRRPQTWRKLSRQRTASDFRALHSVNFGGDLEFKSVGENGEYQSATLEDEATSLMVQRYGRNIALTFEAVVNDDMGLFERLPGEMARRASTLESKIMWSLIRDNEKVGGTSLFHSKHKNVGGVGDIDVINVAAGRKAMWEQRPLGAVDKDDFIEVEPDLLYVPPALETDAMKFVTATVPAKLADANPYSSSLTPVTEARLGAAAGGSDVYWYLFSSELPPLEHAYLDGYEAPTVHINEGMNPDVIKMDARHIFGGSIAEHRGSYRHGG